MLFNQGVYLRNQSVAAVVMAKQKRASNLLSKETKLHTPKNEKFCGLGGDYSFGKGAPPANPPPPKVTLFVARGSKPLSMPITFGSLNSGAKRKCDFFVFMFFVVLF